MGCKRCVLCFKVCVTEKAKQETDGNQKQIGSDGTSNVVDPLQVKHLLQKVLEIPKDICATLSENYGDPFLWIKCCNSCLELVNRARAIFDQILKLKKNYKELQIEMKNVITISAKSEKNIEVESDYEPERMVRSYVINHSCDKMTPVSTKVKIEALPNVDERFDMEYATFPESAMDECVQMEPTIGLYASCLIYGSDTEKEDPLKIEDTDQSNGSNPVLVADEKLFLPEGNELNEFEEEFPFLDNGFNCNIKATAFLKPSDADYPEKKTYFCQCCGKGFDNVGNLKVHVRIHTGEKPFACEICKKSFAHSSDLKRHFRTHTGERPYQCELCSKSFTNSHNLKTHMLTHTTDKVFECDVCGSTFAQFAGLKEHSIKHTGEKPFECEFCCKKFVRLNNFKHHVKTHTPEGDKPFKCYICDDSFENSSLLKKHVVIHTKDDFFECNFCEKKLTSGSSLKIHLETHTMKRHECTHCDLWFAKSARLKLHLKSHWKTSPPI